MQRLTFPVGNSLDHFELMGHVYFSEVTLRYTYTANLIQFVLLKSFQSLDGDVFGETRSDLL